MCMHEIKCVDCLQCLWGIHRLLCVRKLSFCLWGENRSAGWISTYYDDILHYCQFIDTSTGHSGSVFGRLWNRAVIEETLLCDTHLFSIVINPVDFCFAIIPVLYTIYLLLILLFLICDLCADNKNLLSPLCFFTSDLWTSRDVHTLCF